MEILRDKIIDTSKMTLKDKIIKNITGNTMNIQIDGDAKLSMKGSHANFESNNSYAIALINMTTLDKVTETTTPGLYLAIVEGIDEMELEISGSGVIHWKELGD